MTAMRPAPKRSHSLQAPEVEEETTVLDDVIQRIDQSLPLIHRRVAGGGSDETPTKRMSSAQFVRAQAVFQDMKDDPLLNEEGDDICLKKKKKKRIRRPGKINGSQP